MNANKQDAGGEVTNPDNVGGLRYTDYSVMNGLLFDFSTRWKLDGYYIRCRTCKRPQLTSYGDNDFPHASDCRERNSPNMERRPWQTYVELLAPLCRAAPAGGVYAHPGEIEAARRNLERGIGDGLVTVSVKPVPGYVALNSAPAGSGEVEECLMSSEHEWTILDCPHCGRCVKYCKKAISSKEAYRDLTAEVTSLRAERDALLRKLQQGAGHG